jgi:hypothetical protein
MWTVRNAEVRGQRAALTGRFADRNIEQHATNDGQAK